MTNFTKIYDCFLGKITDDMYMEWTKEDTLRDLQSILLNSIPGFEFPRFRLYEYNIEPILIGEDETGEITYEDNSYFADDLTQEEVNILAVLMVNSWLQRQLSSIENIRMKYSGSDFKMTSQANHLAKLINLKTKIEEQDHHLQRLYKRRKINSDGSISSNWSSIMEKSALVE